MNPDPNPDSGLNDDELESLLRGLRPTAPSPALTQRVDDELKLDMSWLGTPRRRPRQPPQWLMSAGWAALGAAAAIAVMSSLTQQQAGGGAPALAAASLPAPASTAVPAPAVLPVSTIREWDDVQDDGIHYSSDRLPEQHVTLISRERQTWIDPRDGAQMTVEIPLQQKLVLPVNFQ
ncbi:hypothetical protein [Prosthecobacter sp.]|uniref:hypothetical protein n=1 Tax=Prosthecobacter sp. TaxID=1965333 RepID=UPI0037852E29